ncbi:hypothetical protein [Phytohabitans kaempferiae]|uniref:Uncharacterized protein n=1 Tax=Phytohabitans kaempferiae TaxID=1620943 RepID=A0ABV6MH65_9ACTN
MRAVVRPTGIQLLARAQDAGVTLTRTGTGIDLDGPADARPLIAARRDRQPLLRNAFWLYTGAARLLDWRTEHRATVIARTELCHLCDQPTVLLDPFDRQPCHKTCAEAALTPAAVVGPVAYRDRAERAA